MTFLPFFSALLCRLPEAYAKFKTNAAVVMPLKVACFEGDLMLDQITEVVREDRHSKVLNKFAFVSTDCFSSAITFFAILA